VSLKKPDAILFDWDGTLIDGFDVIFSGYNIALMHFGLPPMTLEQARANLRLSSREIFPRIFGNDAEEAQKVYYKNVIENHLLHIKTMPGTSDLLDFLKAHHIPMGVVSNKTHAILLREIEHMGWGDYFSAVVGAGVAARDKPAPDPLLLAADQLQMSPDKHELWYIGDTETDMEAAHAARFKPVFTAHGLGEILQLNQFPPAISVNDHNDLIARVKALV
jgi:phosphoglycolate phosphatase